MEVVSRFVTQQVRPKSWQTDKKAVGACGTPGLPRNYESNGRMVHEILTLEESSSLERTEIDNLKFEKVCHSLAGS